MKLMTIVVLLAIATPAAAQVGRLPSQSPFRDIDHRQHITIFGGWFSGAEGRAGVGPQAAPAVGARYELRIGGPLHFTGRLAYVSAQRNVVDPSQIGDARQLGETTAPLAFVDAGLTLYLTGQKSIWHLVPLVSAGIGVATDLGESKDVGGFGVGTPFALSVGGGVRYVGRGDFGLRLDVADNLFKLSYPPSYFIAPAGGTPLLGPGSEENEWKHTLVVTLGVSWIFSR